MGTFTAQPAGSMSFGVPHRDGDKWANCGHDMVIVQNNRGASVRFKLPGTSHCSMGETHDFEPPLGHEIESGKLALMGPFDRYQFNSDGFANFQVTANDGSQLPDDDGQGHPDDVGVAIIRVFTAD